jgi:hypothetical protein
MIVGSNERLFAWMDEGFNTFINSLSSKILIMENTNKVQLIAQNGRSVHESKVRNNMSSLII